jgi:enamine deaminase RidA (YjgF/YER057c/UK114 family)
MTLELINPPDLPIPHTYTQVVVATGSRFVFVAGQEPEDAEGTSSAADEFGGCCLSVCLSDADTAATSVKENSHDA